MERNSPGLQKSPLIIHSQRHQTMDGMSQGLDIHMTEEER